MKKQFKDWNWQEKRWAFGNIVIITIFLGYSIQQFFTPRNILTKAGVAIFLICFMIYTLKVQKSSLEQEEQNEHIQQPAL